MENAVKQNAVRTVCLAAAVAVASLASSATTYRVTAEAKGGGTGETWESPMTLAEACAAATLPGDTILLKAGTYQVDHPCTNSVAVTWNGGLLGSDDSTLADDGSLSVLEGADRTSVPQLLVADSNESGASYVYRRIGFHRAYSQGVYKGITTKFTSKGQFVPTASNPSIVFDHCRFTENGTSVAQKVNGRGASIMGTSSSDVAFSNCLFAGNCEFSRNYNISSDIGDAGQGFGAWISGGRSAVFEGCSFVTNGVSPNGLLDRKWAGNNGFRGAAIYANGVCVKVRNCRFLANRAANRDEGDKDASRKGGIVYLEGGCDGSSFTNCLFAGNYSSHATTAGSAMGAYGGTVVLMLGATAQTVDFDRCTFAYNLADTASASPGLTVKRGTAKVRNSIFYGAMVGKYFSSAAGKDIEVKADGRLDVDYSSFPEDSQSSIYAPSPATQIKRGANLVFGDPRFVTDFEAVRDLAKTYGNYTYYDYSASALAMRVNLDLHVLSKSGYFDNAGEEHVANVQSPAIDSGDPERQEWADEPEPNGARLNLGFYAGTAEASKSVAQAKPCVKSGSLEVKFPDGYSQPVVSFALDSNPAGGDYTADVGVEISTNGVDWILVGRRVGCHNGDQIVIRDVDYYREGDLMRVRITMTTSAAIVVKDGEAQVYGDYPPWYGKGGGPEVVHVRVGATGRGDGSSWTDAYPSFAEALEHWDGEKEIWLAGDFELAKDAVQFTPTNAVALRGGFKGIENGPEDRQAGLRSVLDGMNAYQILNLKNGVSAPMSIERIDFIRSGVRAVEKSDAGDLDIASCAFRSNARNWLSSNGSGAYLSGGGQAKVSISNCVFSGHSCATPGRTDVNEAGRVIYASSLGHLTISDTCFVTNGVMMSVVQGQQGHYRNGADGIVLYAADAPVTVERCRFAANRGTARRRMDSNPYNRGSLILLTGASGGSVFRSCAFVGNQESHGGVSAASGEGSSGQGFEEEQPDRAGVVRVFLGSAEATVLFDGCTFAYNLVDSWASPTAINVEKGAIQVKNSIFFGNFKGLYSQVGTDIDLKPNGSASVDHTLFGDSQTAFSDATRAALVLGEGVKFADPMLVTDLETVSANVQRDGFTFFSPSAADDLSAINVHLRGGMGYVDESTRRLVTTYRREKSPAIDAGDLDSDWTKEPVLNGRRVNMGAYGNTPWATMSIIPGSIFYVR